MRCSRSRPSSPWPRPRSPSACGTRGPRRSAWGTTVDVFRDSLREVWRLHMGLMFCFGLGTGTIFTFLPTFAEDLGVRGLGLFYTAYAVAAMLVRLIGGQLIDLRGPRAVIIPSMFVQVGAALILALVAIFISPAARVPVLPFLFLAGLLAGGAHGFLYPALSALLVDVTPENRRARAVGTFSSVFLLGNAVGSHGVRVRRGRARVSRDVERAHRAAPARLSVEPAPPRRRSDDAGARRVI